MDGEDYARARMMNQGPRRAGNVKFFNSQKGFGFINDRRGEELGGQEVFCHYSAIAGKGGFRSLAEGEEVEYEIVQGPKGFQATNLTGPGGRNVVGDPKARLAQPPPYLPFSSLAMPMASPYGINDPYLQQRAYANSPYTQQLMYAQSQHQPPSAFSAYASQGQLPQQQGSLGLQSPMMGQGMGLGSPSLMGGMSNSIGAFYGGAAGSVGGFGGIGTGMGAREPQFDGGRMFQQQQQQQQAQAQAQAQALAQQGRATSSSSHYFGPLSPPGGHHTSLGPAPLSSFGIFGSHSASNGAPPSSLGFPSLSDAAGPPGSSGGLVSTSYGSSNGFLPPASSTPSAFAPTAGSASGAVGSGSRVGTPREERRGTPLGNGLLVSNASVFGLPQSGSSTTSPTSNGFPGSNSGRAEVGALHLGFEGLSIESQ